MDSSTTSTSDIEDYDEGSELPLDDAPRISSAQHIGDESEEDNGGIKDQSEHASPVAARAYQLEMLEASLRGNIICAMDTGSGKTQV
jgi:superfamily II DNA or RNA helicase